MQSAVDFWIIFSLVVSELFFECYTVPKVCYGVDSFFSHRFNAAAENKTRLIVSVGFHAVHVIPVVDGVVSLEGVRRVNAGGFQMIGYLQRSLQLKYPAHANNITVIHLYCNKYK
jgi:actin-related protein 5